MTDTTVPARSDALTEDDLVRLERIEAAMSDLQVRMARLEEHLAALPAMSDPGKVAGAVDIDMEAAEVSRRLWCNGIGVVSPLGISDGISIPAGSDADPVDVGDIGTESGAGDQEEGRDVPTLQERWELIELIALGEFGALQEGFDGDLVPFVLQAICLELLHLSVNYFEEIPIIKDIQVFLGGMVNGLLFGDDPSQLSEPDSDDVVRRLQRAAHRQGAAILAATGVPPMKGKDPTGAISEADRYTPTGERVETDKGGQ